MKKIYVIVLLFLVTTLSLAKNIFVVYDDSKSMNKDNRNIYANYAMQTLISLLEDEDNLTITKMSDVDNDFRNKLVVDLKNIPNEIKYFRDKVNPCSNVTPYKSVESIIDYINKMDIEDENNWLVIISDGYFEDGKEIPELEKIEEKINKAVKNKKIKPIFLLIGSSEEELDTYERQKGVDIWKEVFGRGEYPKIYKSVGKKDIVDKMNEIAQLLTNKSSSIEKNYKIEGNKIVFSPLFPLNKIILLNQDDEIENKLKEISVDNNKLENIKIYSPKKNSKNLNLNGSIVHINSDNNNLLNQGQLVIEFKNKVPENIQLYPEVAGKFNVTLFDENNKEIKERVVSIEEGKEVKIIGKIENVKNGTPLKYVDGTLVMINYGGEKIQLKYNAKNNQYETKLIILKEKKSIDAIAEYKGYFYYQSDIYIIEGTPKKEVIESKVEPDKKEMPKIEVPKVYSLNLEKNINTAEISQEELKNLKIKIIIKENENLLKLEELKKFKINFNSELDGKIKYEGENCFFIPEIYDGKYGFKKPQGKFVLKIKVEKKDTKLEKEIMIKLKELSFFENYGKIVLEIILIILFFIIVCGYFSKKRFNKKSRILIKEYREDFSKPDNYKILKTSIGNVLTPFISHKTVIDGITFIANGRSLILLGKNLSNKFGIGRVKKVYINGDLIEKEGIGKREKYILYNENSIKVIYEDDLTREYIYQKN